MNSKFFRTFPTMAVALLLAACTQDELSSPTGGVEGALPEGKYPLEIANVSISADVTEEPWSADAPQTRVSENADGNSSAWKWDGTEKIGVQLYAIAKEGEPQHWVDLVTGSVTPGVDAVLQSAYWNTEVDAGNGVKVTKLKEKPARLDWVDKLLNQ